METTNQQQGLKRLNALPADEAESEFLKCCGSREWAQRMVRERPFANPEELMQTAAQVWRGLGSDDWLEAFHSHPKIGEQKAAAPTSTAAAQWSKEEQAGTRNSAPQTMKALAELNSEYHQKFGFIFIVCATGKRSEEMLAILQDRLGNDPETELIVAAEEQSKITELRLKKLIEAAEK